jgi:anti-sigma B factor antagonist
MDVRTIEDIAIAGIVRRFDAYTANEVEESLKDIMEKGTKKILCDFSQTEYIASAGLRVLLSAAKNLKKVDGQIVMASLKPFVQEVFEISGFTQIFKIFNSQEEALRALK